MNTDKNGDNNDDNDLCNSTEDEDSTDENDFSDEELRRYRRRNYITKDFSHTYEFRQVFS